MAKRSFLQLQEVIDLKRPKVGNVEPDDDFRAKMCVCSAIAAVIGSFKLDRQKLCCPGRPFYSVCPK